LFYAPLPSRPGSPVYDILGAARFAAGRIGYWADAGAGAGLEVTEAR